jgi:hypothetical protein
MLWALSGATVTSVPDLAVGIKLSMSLKGLIGNLKGKAKRDAILVEWAVFMGCKTSRRDMETALHGKAGRQQRSCL